MIHDWLSVSFLSGIFVWTVFECLRVQFWSEKFKSNQEETFKENEKGSLKRVSYMFGTFFLSNFDGDNSDKKKKKKKFGTVVSNKKISKNETLTHVRLKPTLHHSDAIGIWNLNLANCCSLKKKGRKICYWLEKKKANTELQLWVCVWMNREKNRILLITANLFDAGVWFNFFLLFGWIPLSLCSLSAFAFIFVFVCFVFVCDGYARISIQSCVWHFWPADTAVMYYILVQNLCTSFAFQFQSSEVPKFLHSM